MSYIYKITNDVNEKLYIGQTVQNIYLRWSQHCYDAFNSKSERLICKALRKYGVEHFSIEILEECSTDRLDEREKYWIEHLQSKMPNGYNMNDGGNGTHGSSDKDIIQYYLQNKDSKTLTQISYDLKAGFTRVRDVLEREGIREKRKYSLISSDELESLIFDYKHGVPIKELVKIYHRDYSVIKKKLVAAGFNICESSESSLLRRKRIVQLSLKGDYIQTWESGHAARVHYNNRHITEVAAGKRKTAAGFKWIWEEDYKS